jgi:propionyl-CoA carboxylase alpha chain
VNARRFSSLLVANRGEIARRVFRTAQAMGLRCVAVHTGADAGAPFVADADEAVLLSGGYLDMEAILDAARATGAEAIHPGYGFLSENATFAEAVSASGLVWVGPSPESIAAMGDKLAAKRAAVSAGVPTLPSGDAGTAAEVGFPLLVKAAAGGGGKGMRVVEQAAALDAAVAAATREASAAFGDGTVFVERAVRRARHVEIQILGDAHGNVVHLGERECSIQRRHQKVIEESPSPIVDPAMREAMGEAALRLAKSIGYRSAGTVEFLIDDDTREFFFLEVNTRLQVEHPVTELVTGLDLVRQQLLIAAGESLAFGQDDITFSGHAVEARLYAEDPAAGFLPATGILAAFVPPEQPAIRWDSGVDAGSVVSVEFDPMLAKVISHAPTRSEAAGRLALALERLHVGGVTTNRDFLVATLRARAFLDGDTTTDFIERVEPVAALPDVDRAAAIAALWLQGRNRAEAGVLAGLPSGWRNGRLPAQHAVLAHGDRVIDVRYRSRRDGTFQLGDGAIAQVHDWSPAAIDVEIGGRRLRSAVTAAGNRLHVQLPSGTVDVDIVPRFAVAAGDDAGHGGLVAPMPGVVHSVHCAIGDVVATRQPLLILEAMKMEHPVVAPQAGTVTDVRVALGEHVTTGTVLVVLQPLPTEATA